jgi:hypothetical protein
MGGGMAVLSHGFAKYINLPMKYTVSGSTLQYTVGLTLSFLSNFPGMEF